MPNIDAIPRQINRDGDGIVTALRLINNLEINQEILYGRMENIEQRHCYPDDW